MVLSAVRNLCFPGSFWAQTRALHSSGTPRGTSWGPGTGHLIHSPATVSFLLLWLSWPDLRNAQGDDGFAIVPARATVVGGAQSCPGS